MIFEKKIIIGSVLSFITATVGFIAIFFPDIFNLQKKKLGEINLVVNSEASYEEFEKSIANYISNEEIFKANIYFCSTAEDPWGEKFWSEDLVNEQSEKIIIDDSPELHDTTEVSLAIDEERNTFTVYESFNDSNESYNPDIDEVLFFEEYSFPRDRVNFYTYKAAINYPCDGFELKGYFTFDRDERGKVNAFAAGAIYYFREVPSGDVKLKNY